MSLRSVPDARRPVPLLWWVPVVALLMLGVTGVAILPGVGSGITVLVAAAVSIVGYAAVWLCIRPGRLRVGPYRWPDVEAVAQDRTDPPTITFAPIAAGRAGTGAGRRVLLLLNSASVGMGAMFAWAVVANLLIHPAVPASFRPRTTVRSVGGAVVDAALNAALTSVLEECGIAVLILAVAALAQRYLPTRVDRRSVAVIAVLTATIARTALHIPLWGVGAVGRIGLSFVLAGLFWRTRRIWPLIVVHVLWDTLTLQTLLSPSLHVRSLSALAVLAWGITGLVLAIIAVIRSKRNTGRAAHYYRRLGG